MVKGLGAFKCDEVGELPDETVNMSVNGHELTVYLRRGAQYLSKDECGICHAVGSVYWYEPKVRELYENGVRLRLNNPLAKSALEKLLKSGDYQTKLCAVHDTRRFRTLFQTL